MTKHTSSGHITTDPAIFAGKPVIAGTRISVQLILEKMRDGWTIDDLLDDYPHLTREQIVAALDYAADAMSAVLREPYSTTARTRLLLRGGRARRASAASRRV